MSNRISGNRRPRILITGVAGFIGSNLADRLLQEGYSVTGIDNLAYGVKAQIPSGVRFFKADIRSPKIYPLFKNIDYVFHLAAKNCIGDCQEDPVETSDINVTGTVNVFEASKRSQVKKVIYAESSAIYEGSKKYPTPEEEVAPQSFYAQSKLAEKLFADAYGVFFGLKSTALRYFCVYGPRQDYRRTVPPVMSAFIIRLLKKQRPVIYGSGKKRRDFVYVDDVNDFHLRCITDQRTDGGTFNLGSGENYSVQDIYEIIENELRSGIKPIYKADLPGESELTLADARRAKALGWKAKTSLEQGVRASIQFIKSKVMPRIARHG